MGKYFKEIFGDLLLLEEVRPEDESGELMDRLPPPYGSLAMAVQGSFGPFSACAGGMGTSEVQRGAFGCFLDSSEII